MAQRVSTISAAAPGSRESTTSFAGAPGQQQHPEELHTMPNALRRIPEWYQDSTFQYNARLMVGVAPGLFLLLTVTGKPMFGAILAGVFVINFFHYLKHSWLSMVLSVAHVVLLEVVNVYCMAPLMWRSILNVPLFGLFHVFIGLTGVLWMIQDNELLRQDPRFTILLERVLFYLCPALFVATVSWIAGILFGLSVLPFVVLVSGFVAFSLFLVPLQSSFARPNTPTNTGLIQHWVVVWLYFVLLLTVPALLFSAITYQHSLQFFLVLGLLVCSPMCLLSLLEAQGLGVWFGSWPALMHYVRMLSASIVICLVSWIVLLTQPPSLLPLLLLPILFTTLGLASVAGQSSTNTLTLTLGALLALLYGAAFVQLPWSIQYSSKFLSLPLTTVQLLLWGVALGAAGLITCWSKATPIVLVSYNAVFIMCEFILSADGVYPHYLSFITGVAAIYTFWRLHTIGKLSLDTSLTIMCLHLTKLSLFYPCEHSLSMLTSTVLPLCSTFLTSFVLLRLFVFDHTPFLTWSQLLAYSGLLLVGLLLSVDTFLSPMWASLTHTLPTSASQLAFVLGTVAVCVSYGCSLLGPQETPPLFMTSLPPSLAVMAALLAFLQPQFSVYELADSFMVITGDTNYLPEPQEVYLMIAWTNLLTWLVLFSMLFALVQLVYPQWSAMTPVSLAFLGVLAGFYFSISLAESLPGGLESILYASIMAVGGALCGRALTGKHMMKWMDYVLFAFLCVLSIVIYYMEWRSKVPVFIQGASILERYSVPCILVVAITYLGVAFSCRLAKYRSPTDDPYLPMLGNLACLFFFMTMPLHRFHQETEITVLFCSLVFLLSQPDGYVRPHTSHLFIAPSLLGSIVLLYAMALTNVFMFLFHQLHRAPQVVVAGYAAELISLLLSIPGQGVFLHSLWVGKNTLPSLSGPTFSANRVMLLLYLLPSGFLPQFSNSLATSILGSVGIFNFCLAVIGNSQLNIFQ